MRKKILLVEDDSDVIELLSFNLKRAGFAIGTAVDGISAIKKARSMRPDLILLDLMLPELDGLAVCEILRREPETNRVPVIMLTALDTQLARLSGFEAGADAYVTKPFKWKELLNRIQGLLTEPAGCRSPSGSRDCP